MRKPEPSAPVPLWQPPGHYYSPIPDPREIEARAEELFDRTARELPGLDLREPEQLELLKQLRPFYDELPFTPEPTEGLRYYYENDQYSYSDGIFLYSMLRHLRPRRVVEVGSGYSSCLMLDVNERFLEGATELTFIEPYPERLRSRLREGDLQRATLLQERVQDVPLDRFAALEDGDVLFVDSSHVSKAGSDVNHLLFEVLPRLASGVTVHFHDVHFPFEYPQEWVVEGRAWSEAYLLRAFLQFNSGFEIVLFNTALELWHTDWFRREMPLCLANPGGSLWLRKRVSPTVSEPSSSPHTGGVRR